jgi:hypothetical protein
MQTAPELATPRRCISIFIATIREAAPLREARAGMRIREALPWPRRDLGHAYYVGVQDC